MTYMDLSLFDFPHGLQAPTASQWAILIRDHYQTTGAEHRLHPSVFTMECSQTIYLFVRQCIRTKMWSKRSSTSICSAFLIRG